MKMTYKFIIKEIQGNKEKETFVFAINLDNRVFTANFIKKFLDFVLREAKEKRAKSQLNKNEKAK